MTDRITVRTDYIFREKKKRQTLLHKKQNVLEHESAITQKPLKRQQVQFHTQTPKVSTAQLTNQRKQTLFETKKEKHIIKLVCITQYCDDTGRLKHTIKKYWTLINT